MLIPETIFESSQVFEGTKGLVFIGDKIIVYRRDKNAPQHPLKLDVPGGGREGNETPFQNFQREVNEEFGLNLTRDDLRYGRRYEASDGSGRIGYYLVAKLEVVEAEKIVFGNEGQDFTLMTLEEFLDRHDVWPAYQERSKDYLETLKR